MGRFTSFLSTLTVILTLTNICIGFERFREEFEEDLVSRELTWPKFLPSWAKKYTDTRRPEGCPCWWDLTQGYNCACCRNRGIQCGYPLHRYCQRDAGKPQYRKGCPGIKNKDHTLSERGHPCHYNTADKTCGWCGLFSQQCNGWNLYNGIKCGEATTFFPGKSGSSKSCAGQVQDCRLSPSPCDVNAECVNTGRKTKGQYGGYAYRCACKKGFIGNGIHCANEKTGVLELPSEGMVIELSMNLAPQIEIYRTEKNFPIGKATADFERELKNMQAENDGNEVFCNGNSGRKYSWNDTRH